MSSQHCINCEELVQCRRDFALEQMSVRNLTARVEELEKQIKQNSEVMFYYFQRGAEIEFKEVRSSKDVWTDCAKDGPVWDWVNYIYRVKKHD